MSVSFDTFKVYYYSSLDKSIRKAIDYFHEDAGRDTLVKIDIRDFHNCEAPHHNGTTWGENARTLKQFFQDTMRDNAEVYIWMRW